MLGSRMHGAVPPLLHIPSRVYFLFNSSQTKFPDRVFEVIALMGAASTSETSVYFYQTTRRYNP
jgi:hypothetical protein